MTDEAALLAAVQASPDDDLPRLVYADWLDDHNRPGGNFLRVECLYAAAEEGSSHRLALQGKLRKTSCGVDPVWVVSVSRVPIENCEFAFRCPKRWESLQVTDEAGVRFCDECQRSVYFCESIPSARRRAVAGECVAIDARMNRRPGDITPPRWDDSMTIGILVSLDVPRDSGEFATDEPRKPWWRRLWG